MLIDLVVKALDDKLDIIQHEILLYSGYLRTHANLKGFNEVQTANSTAICRILYEKLSQHMGIDLQRPVGIERLKFIENIQTLQDTVNELEHSLLEKEQQYLKVNEALTNKVNELTEQLRSAEVAAEFFRSEVHSLKNKSEPQKKTSWF